MSKRKTPFSEEIDKKAVRKQKARRQAPQSAWFGLGMMGLVGWSITIPTLLGAMLGLWLDKTYKDPRSWALTLLLAGLIIGCLNAWYWVTKEDKAINEEQENNHGK